MEYIKKNIIKLNFIMIGVFLILSPIIFYYNFNYTSDNTKQKNFILLKSGEPSFQQKTNLLSTPIINSETLIKYTKDSVVDIFSYETYQHKEHLNKIEKYFTNLGFQNFKSVFNYMIQQDQNTESVVKKTIVVDGPYLLGTGNILGEKRIWKYILQSIELRQGIGGKQRKEKSIEIILKEMKFSKNNKGVAIDSMIVK